MVRKIDTGSIIQTVAGGGELGVLGDRGPATEASFKGAGLEIAIDNEGNLIKEVPMNRARRRKLGIKRK